MEIARVNGKPVRFSKLSFNESLFYLIKKTTGDSDSEILSYFYEIGIKLFNDCISKKRLPQRCNRVVKLFYKESDIYVKFSVISNFFNSRYTDSINLDMHVFFSPNKIIIDSSSFIQIVSETHLGLSDELSLASNKPQEKLYKCIKDNRGGP